MAKDDKVLPARKQRARTTDDDSLLLRSAESLGRMIGSLQRQLESVGITRSRTGATKAEEAPRRRATKRAAERGRSTTAKTGAQSERKQGARKQSERKQNERKSKRASKSARAKKPAARSRR